MSVVVVPAVPSAGIKPLHLGANGRVTSGPAQARIANFVNMLVGRRCKVLMSRYNGVGTASTKFQDGCEGQFRTSAYPSNVFAVVLLTRTNSATVHGTCTWTVGPPGAGVAQATQYVGGNTTASDAPNDLFIISQVFVDGSGDPLAGSTAYNTSMALGGTNIAVVGMIIYELPSGTLDTSVSGLSCDVSSVGSPVLDRDLAAITDRLWAYYCDGGTHHIRWLSVGGGRPRTSATYANVLDGSTAGYSAAAAGHWTWPYRRSTLAGTTVPVTLWVMASTNVGSTGRVRFVNSAGTIGTITGIGTTKQIYSTTATLDATLTSDLVITEHSDSAANTITTYGFGCYDLTT